jgi:ornithine cyclodeaminase/alanine dehydrogenase-like protein (mu-crystallin family)
MDVPFLSEAAVADVLRMEDLIPRMRQAMIDYSAGHVEQPARRILDVKAHGGYFGSMPAVSPDAMGAKLVSIYPDNESKGLEAHMALVVLFDPETGQPLVTMDGSLITKMRTAAVTATFVDAVAATDVSSLAILGAGAQAKSHVEALSCIRDFDDIRIWNRTPERAEELAESIGARVTSCEEAVRDTDVVVATTASTEPIFDGRWLKNGAKIASVGWAGADSGELDATTMSNVVIVDSREGALVESGNVRRSNAGIYAELGEVLSGSRPIEPGATVVFESIGMACQDLAAASLVVDKTAPMRTTT